MRPELALIERSLAALPVFPLPSAVLLPYEVLPLHVFEPRYREMTQYVVTHGGVLALASPARGGEGDYEGRPPLEPVCGAGLVVRHEKLDDGRYNILVRGVARVHVTDELPADQKFRRIRAELL